MRIRTVTCPNPKCDYHGLPRRERRALIVDGCLLTLFGLLPGLLYFAFKSGYRYYCPKCGIQLGSDD